MTKTATILLAMLALACVEDVDHVDPVCIGCECEHAPCEDWLVCDAGECIDPSDQCVVHPGSIGCACPAEGCMENLECMDGFCGPCPDEQEGCACGPLGTCETGLVCSAGTCS